MKSPTRAEEFAQKHSKEYEKGALDQKTLHQFPAAMQQAYLRRGIMRKYAKTGLSDDFCPHCGVVVLYQDAGYITDDELLALAGGAFRPK